MAGEVSAQLRTNPLLEDVSAGDFADRPQSVGGPEDGEFSDFDDGYGESSDTDAANDAAARRDFALNSIPDKISLREHLLNEANLDAPSEGAAKAFAFFAGELDDRGIFAGAMPRRAPRRLDFPKRTRRRR